MSGANAMAGIGSQGLQLPLWFAAIFLFQINTECLNISALASSAVISTEPNAAPISLNLRGGESKTYEFSLSKTSVVIIDIKGHIQESFSKDDKVYMFPSITIENSRERIVPWNGWEYGFEHAVFTYLLPRGDYDLHINGQDNYFRSDIGKVLLQGKLALRLANPPPMPDWLPEMNAWLRRVGLKDRIWLAAAVKGPDFNLGELDSSNVPGIVAGMAVERGDIHAEEENNDIGQLPGAAADAKLIAALQAKAYFDDKWLIIVGTTFDRFDLGSIEGEFRSKYGISLWKKIFSKISLLTDIPPSQIFAKIDMSCSGEEIFEDASGDVRRRGWECHSYSEGVDASSWIASNLTRANTRSLKGSVPNFENSVIQYLEGQATALGATIKYASRKDTYVEATVSGVRGWVIKGGKQWEKVQIAFALMRESDKAELRIFTDGRLASGEHPPVDTRYEYDMEPKYSANLTDFSKILLDNFLHYEKPR